MSNSINQKQFDMLNNLVENLENIYTEALNDDNFNEKLAELGIFKVSIDEAISKIYDNLDDN